MKLKFWGTRGSIPVTGNRFCKYGGNTPSIEINNDKDNVIIIDAGSGIRELGIELVKRNHQKKIYLFFSHFHTDHIVGLPFFAPFYRDDFEIEIFGKPYILNSTEKILDLIFNPPLFSITKDKIKAKCNFHDIDETFTLSISDIKIETEILNHPHPTLGFKILSQNKSVVYFTDNELIQKIHKSEEAEELLLKNHSNLISFCKGVDILIHDSSYFTEDYNIRVGWGHSSNITVAMFAHLAEVKNLYLFHYDPDYDDKKIDKLLEETRNYLKNIGSSVNCFASSDLMELNL
jgi:phosphoribosyl 1,2-cyclic phosphodiesterase